MRTATTKRRRTGRRRRWPAVVVLALLWLGGVAWTWPDLIARIVHPARFTTTGVTMLPLDAYAAAAARRLPAGDRIGEMILPTGRAPVIVIASRVRLWLDPPTARVLAVATRGSELVAVEPAQDVAAVARRARAIAPGRIRRVVWPGSEPGQPDWLVTLTTYDRETVVKVADDTATGGAAVARVGRWHGSGAVGMVRWSLLVVPPLALVTMMAWRRRWTPKPKPKPKPKRRGRST